MPFPDEVDANCPPPTYNFFQKSQKISLILNNFQKYILLKICFFRLTPYFSEKYPFPRVLLLFSWFVFAHRINLFLRYVSEKSE